MEEHMAASSDVTTSAPGFLGAWFVDIRVGEPPEVLRRDVINPLSADALMSFQEGGSLIASGTPSYAIPDHIRVISGDRLQVGARHGSWVDEGEQRAQFRGAALLYGDDGNSVATLLIEGTAEIDPEHDTFSGPYVVEPHLSRRFTGNLPDFNGSVQGWRIGRPGAGS
jgi:hypothetical protein